MSILSLPTPLKIAAIAGFLLTAAALAQSTNAAGRLQVTVTDQQGQPLAGATVQYVRLIRVVSVTGTHPNTQQMPAPGEVAVHGEVETDSTGSLTVTGLPVGRYVLCAEVRSAAWLNPCIWQQPVVVAVSDGATTTQSLVLVKGVFLNVRVRDPKGLMPQTPDGIWSRPKLKAGVVYHNGAYQEARNIRTGSTGHDYQLVIPARMPMALRLFSTDIVLTGEDGLALDMSGSKIPFEAFASQDRNFEFTVAREATQ